MCDISFKRIGVFRKASMLFYWKNHFCIEIRMSLWKKGEIMDTMNENRVVSEQETRILNILRELEYGKIVITMRNGEPVHVEVQKSIQLQ